MKMHFRLLLQVFLLFNHNLCFTVPLLNASAVLYQMSYSASLLHQNNHARGGAMEQHRR